LPLGAAIGASAPPSACSLSAIARPPGLGK
jgi:hypothetical protein